MRRWILLVIGALSVLSFFLISGCFVRHPGPPHRSHQYRSGQHRHRRNCRQVCTRWVYRHGHKVCRAETTRCR